MSEYKDDLKAVSKEIPGTAWFIFKWGLLALLVLGVLVFIAQSMGIISMDIGREVVQHSRQYTETKTSLLEKLHSDYLQLDAEVAELSAGKDNDEIISAKRAQQKAITKRIKTEAGRIPSSQLPTSIRTSDSDTPGRSPCGNPGRRG